MCHTLNTGFQLFKNLFVCVSSVMDLCSFVEFCKGNNCMVDGHLDRSDEDTTFRKLRQMLEDLDMNMDGPDSGGES